MNVGMRIMLATRSEGLKADISRLNELFNDGLERFGGPWFAGDEFTIADATFAPISSRCRTYGIELEGAGKEYMDLLFEHPVVQEWVQAGIRETAREPLHEEEFRAGGRTCVEITGQD